MNKSTHFIGQPLYVQLLNYFNRDKILSLSQAQGGEHYIKKFDAWHHLVVMLYAVMMRLDSLREIKASLFANVNRFNHLGLKHFPYRSTLSDANKRRDSEIFGSIYMNLYEKYRHELYSDSRNCGQPKWLKNLKIIDSTTISLFSNLVFKGVGRNPKTGKKKGGIKVHTEIFANENVPSDIKFTSAASHDQFALIPERYANEELIAFDRAYINYEKFSELTQRGVIYVTKMKNNLSFERIADTDYEMTTDYGAVRVETILFHKHTKEKDIYHKARKITYQDKTKKGKIRFISLLTNDFQMSAEDIIAIYKRRWQIETLFKQIKQNFPLRYFYGESANAIKIQIWITLIANLLITLVKNKIKRPWSFSGLATMIRILLMSYVSIQRFFEQPHRDWDRLITQVKAPPEELSLF